jgi:hypothetical protein
MDVVHRADIKSPCLLIHMRLSGKKYDGYIPRILPQFQLCTHFVPIHVRHHNVEQDQVGQRCNFCQFQRFRTARCDADLVDVFQNRIHNLNVGRSIIHQQHSLLLISLVHQSLPLCATSGNLIQFHQRRVKIEIVDRCAQTVQVWLLDNTC